MMPFDERTRERFLFSSVGLVLLASLAAFLLYVPIINLVFAMVVVLGFVLMFIFGFYVGNRPPDSIHEDLERFEDQSKTMPASGNSFRTKSFDF